MTTVGPTPEQAERLNAALKEARQTPSERDQRLSAVELAIQMTGDGLPEEAVESLIDMILDREPPRPPGEDLIEPLFGRLPDTIFEELGQLAACRALSERLVATLLRTLGYAGDLARPPADLFNLCEEQAAVLTPDLRQAVTQNLAGCRDVARWQLDYEATVMHRYRTGKFDTEGRGLDAFDMDNAPEVAARTVLELRNLIDRCERR